MADQIKNSKSSDLPPKKVSRTDEENVKGGAEPINTLKRPKPAEPITD